MLTRLNELPSALCLSDLRIDQFMADELSAPERFAFHAHLAICASCRKRFAAFDAERALFITVHPMVPEWLADAPRRAKAVRYYAPLLVAAIALLALVRPSFELRTKGSEALGFYVKRSAEVRRGSVAEPVRPGDQVRFTYSAPRARYLAILSVDATNKASAYFPATPDAARVEPGSERPLPSAIELDAVLGKEQVLAVFCDRPFTLAPLLTRLARSEPSLQLSADCVTDRLMLHKEALRR